MGGFGEVYRATELGLERPVALKILHPGDDSDTLRMRFKREAKLMARLQSPNTVRLYDFGEWGGELFMVLEFVDGKDLAEVVERHGPFDAERIVSVLRQALRSLAEAHETGVLHRDIKLQNLMIYESADQSNLVKLLDFGIAQFVVDEALHDDQTVGATLGRALTSEGELIGTPRYMSPEQARGRPLDATSDLYSLGICALELATGRPWLEGESALEVAHAHIDPEPNRLPHGTEIDPDLTAIIERLAQKRPEARYESAREALADLERWDRREPLQPVSTTDEQVAFALKPTDYTGPHATGIPTWITSVPTRNGKFRYEFQMRNFDEQRIAVELYDTEPLLMRLTTVPSARSLPFVVGPLLGLSLMFSGKLALGLVGLAAFLFLALNRDDSFRVVELTFEGEQYELVIRDDSPVQRSDAIDTLRKAEVRDNGLWLAAQNEENDALLVSISETAENRARWLEGKLNQKIARLSRPATTPATVRVSAKP